MSKILMNQGLGVKKAIIKSFCSFTQKGLNPKSKMIAKTSFKTLFVNALKRRDLCQHSSMSLVNGSLDQLRDLTVHQYGEHVMIQTASRESDKWIPEACELLKQARKPKSLWLKNNCELRHRRQLPLSDHLLFGEDPRQISIAENGFTYSYPTHSNELWPLKDRLLRQHLHLWQKQNANQSFLYVGAEALFQVNVVLKPNDSVILNPPHFALACESLRKLSLNKSYPLIVCHFPLFISNDKNKKALFHLLYQCLNLLTDHGQIWLHHFSPNDWLLGLLQKASQSQKRQLLKKFQIRGESDFPIILQNKESILATLHQFSIDV